MVDKFLLHNLNDIFMFYVEISIVVNNESAMKVKKFNDMFI